MEEKLRTLKSYFTPVELNSNMNLDGNNITVNDFIDKRLANTPGIESAPIEYLVTNIKKNLKVEELPLGEVSTLEEVETIINDTPIDKEKEKQELLANLISKHPEWVDKNIIDNGTGELISYREFLLTRPLSLFNDDLTEIKRGPKFISINDDYESRKNDIDNKSVKISRADKVQTIEQSYVLALACYNEIREDITNYILSNGLTINDYIHSLVNDVDDHFDIDLEKLGFEPNVSLNPNNISDLIYRLVAYAAAKINEKKQEITQEILINNKAFDKVEEVQEITFPIPIVDNKDNLSEEEKKSLINNLNKPLELVLESTLEEDMLNELQSLSRAIDKHKGDVSLERRFKNIMERINNECSSERPFYNRMMAEAESVSRKIENAKNIHKGQKNAEVETYEYYKKKATLIENKIDNVKTIEDYAFIKKEISNYIEELGDYYVTNSKIRELAEDLKTALNIKRFSVNAREEKKKEVIKAELDALSHTIRFSADNPQNKDILDNSIEEMIDLLNNSNGTLTSVEIDYYNTIINNARSTMEREEGLRAVL